MRTLTPSSWLDAPGEQGAGTDPRMSPSHSFFLCPLLVVHLPTLPTPKGPSPPGTAQRLGLLPVSRARLGVRWQTEPSGGSSAQGEGTLIFFLKLPLGSTV